MMRAAETECFLPHVKTVAGIAESFDFAKIAEFAAQAPKGRKQRRQVCEADVFLRTKSQNIKPCKGEPKIRDLLSLH